jgi:hypothetical protein
VAGLDIEEETAREEALPNEETLTEGSRGAALLRGGGAETVDTADEAGGAGRGTEPDEARGTSTEDTETGGGVYE